MVTIVVYLRGTISVYLRGTYQCTNVYVTLEFDYSDCTEIRKTFKVISVISFIFNTYLIMQYEASTTFSQRFLVVENTYGITIFQAIPRVL